MTWVRIDEARQAVQEVSAFERLSVLADLHSRMTPVLWLRLVGEFWAVADGDRRKLSALLLAHPDWHPMMNKAEAREWRFLPSSFVAWRGCYAGLNEGGLSFSLERETARVFPFLARYRRDDAPAIALRVFVQREECALKMYGGETEILARSVEVLSSVRLRYVPLKICALDPAHPL